MTVTLKINIYFENLYIPLFYFKNNCQKEKSKLKCLTKYVLSSKMSKTWSKEKQNTNYNISFVKIKEDIPPYGRLKKLFFNSDFRVTV